MNRILNSSLAGMIILLISENAFASTLDVSSLRDALLAMPEWFYWAFVISVFFGTVAVGILIGGHSSNNQDEG